MLLVVIVLGLVVIGAGALLKVGGQAEVDREAERKARKGIVPIYKRSSAADVGGASGLFLWGGSSDGCGFDGGHHGGGFDSGFCGGGDGGSGGGDSGGC